MFFIETPHHSVRSKRTYEARFTIPESTANEVGEDHAAAVPAGEGKKQRACVLTDGFGNSRCAARIKRQSVGMSEVRRKEFLWILNVELSVNQGQAGEIGGGLKIPRL